MLYAFSYNSHLYNCDNDVETISKTLSVDSMIVKNARREDIINVVLKDGDILYLTGHSYTVFDPTKSRGMRIQFQTSTSPLSEDDLYSILNTKKVKVIIDTCKAAMFTRTICNAEFYCSSDGGSFSFDKKSLSNSIFTHLFCKFYHEYEGEKLIRRINIEYARMDLGISAIYKSLV